MPCDRGHSRQGIGVRCLFGAQLLKLILRAGFKAGGTSEPIIGPFAARICERGRPSIDKNDPNGDQAWPNTHLDTYPDSPWYTEGGTDPSQEPAYGPALSPLLSRGVAQVNDVPEYLAVRVGYEQNLCSRIRAVRAFIGALPPHVNLLRPTSQAVAKVIVAALRLAAIQAVCSLKGDGSSRVEEWGGRRRESWWCGADLPDLSPGWVRRPINGAQVLLKLTTAHDHRKEYGDECARCSVHEVERATLIPLFLSGGTWRSAMYELQRNHDQHKAPQPAKYVSNPSMCQSLCRDQTLS